MNPGVAVRVFVLLFCTQLVVIMDRMASNFLGPFLARDLQLSHEQIGLLAAATGLCWAVSALVFGMVADRVGRRRVLLPAVVVFSCSSILSGFATSFHELLAARALLGLAEGPCFAVTMALAEAFAPPGQRARRVGMVNSAGPLAAGLTPLIVTQVAVLFSWRAGFWSVALPGLVLAVLLWRWMPEPERAAGPAHAEGGARRQVFGNPQVWLCMVGALGLISSVLSFVVFCPLYLTQSVGLDDRTTGMIMSASGFGGVLWSFFGAGIADRVGRRPALFGLAALNALCVGLFLVPALLARPMLLGVLVFVLSSGPAVGALIMGVLPAEIAGRRHAATAIGFTSIGAEIFGGSATPAFAGWLAARGGLSLTLWLSVASGLVVAVVALLLRETRPASPLAAEAAAGPAAAPVHTQGRAA